MKNNINKSDNKSLDSNKMTREGIDFTGFNIDNPLSAGALINIVEVSDTDVITQYLNANKQILDMLKALGLLLVIMFYVFYQVHNNEFKCVSSMNNRLEILPDKYQLGDNIQKSADTVQIKRQNKISDSKKDRLDEYKNDKLLLQSRELKGGVIRDRKAVAKTNINPGILEPGNLVIPLENLCGTQSQIDLFEVEVSSNNYFEVQEDKGLDSRTQHSLGNLKDIWFRCMLPEIRSRQEITTYINDNMAEDVKDAYSNASTIIMKNYELQSIARSNLMKFVNNPNLNNLHTLQLNLHLIDDDINVLFRKLSNCRVIEVNMEDVSGRTIFKNDFISLNGRDNKNDLNTSSLSAGWYLLNFVTTTGVISEKILIIEN